LLVLFVLAAFPWVERKLTGDHRAHNIIQLPRYAPNRTAFGTAFLTWVFLIFLFGSADRIFVLWGLSYNTQLTIFRIGIWVVPALLFFLVRRVCRERQQADRIEAQREEAEEESRRLAASTLRTSRLSAP
jgi:ubiquinol-cytochrome c reductase cytochrome b subunit